VSGVHASAKAQRRAQVVEIAAASAGTPGAGAHAGGGDMEWTQFERGGKRAVKTWTGALAAAAALALVGGCAAEGTSAEAQGATTLPVSSDDAGRCDVALENTFAPVASLPGYDGPYLGSFIQADVLITNTGSTPLRGRFSLTSGDASGEVLNVDHYELERFDAPIAPGETFRMTLNQGRKAGDARFFGLQKVTLVLPCLDAAGEPATLRYDLERPPTGDQQMSCGDVAARDGYRRATCEWNGNGACKGAGPETLDCAHCCDEGEAMPGPSEPEPPPSDLSCGAYAAANGWAAAKCEWNGNDACGGRGARTTDCNHCCPD
jgi:hypothetical protein